MTLNQNETGCELRVTRREARVFACRTLVTRASRPAPRAFTLTELLVVITIIAVLASLITVGVSNALRKANQAVITLEIQQLSNAMDDLKNEFGAYPPNVFPNGDATLGLTNDEKKASAQILLRFVKKAFPRSNEFQVNMFGAAPDQGKDLSLTPASRQESIDNIFPATDLGISPAEALVFWLQGFSQNVSRPITGTDLVVTQIEYTNPVSNSVETPTNVITIETRKPRYDFDRGRLRMSFNPINGNRRFLLVQRTDGTPIQIQLYEYLAKNSEEPFVYFDTSRETPKQVVNNWETTEFFYSSLISDGIVYPLKQMRANAPSTASTLDFVEYVSQDKFQILHCGIDDFWGDFSDETGGSQGELDVDKDNGGFNYIPLLLFPEGPFIGDIADTVGNFGIGTLADEQE